MKQGINIHMPVKFCGIDFSKVDEIEFVFKQQKAPFSPTIKSSLYKSDGTGDAQLLAGSTNIVLVPWSQTETYRFSFNCEFFMDTRIKVIDSSDNPVTPIVKLFMNDTLFKEGE